MKKELHPSSGRRGDDDENSHERNKRIKSEHDRRLRKALRHPRYADDGNEGGRQ